VFQFEKYSFGKKRLVPHLNAADLVLWTYQKQMWTTSRIQIALVFHAISSGEGDP
jgi:hypothetical protein